MALSPLVLCQGAGTAPAVGAPPHGAGPWSCAAWQMLMTMGEVMWSPRNQAWSASMAPTGREGVFVALSQVKSLLMAPVGSFVSGWLNERYQPDCHNCRSSAKGGNNHFCSFAANTSSCAIPPILGLEGDTVHRPPCPLPPDGWIVAGGVVQCPSFCSACPGWAADTATMWQITLALSMISPVAVWLFLPFIRGEGHRENKYAMLECDGTRLADCLLAGDGSRGGRRGGHEAATAAVRGGEGGLSQSFLS
eukprot:SAG11_NODE_371_length_10051_cov_5.987741_7_plen_250_part_00